MASVSMNSLFVCRQCIRNLSTQPRALRTTGTPLSQTSQSRSIRTHHRPRGMHPKTSSRLSKTTDRSDDLVALSSQPAKSRPPPTQSQIHTPSSSRPSAKPTTTDRSDDLVDLSSNSLKPRSPPTKRPRQPPSSPRLSAKPSPTSKPLPSSTPAISPSSSSTNKPLSPESSDLGFRKATYAHHHSTATQNYYWQTLAPSIHETSSASHFFTARSTVPQFLRSVVKFREFPEGDVPEVAFVGRSNAGKSSLLNAIVHADATLSGKVKELARVSKTPGCTRMMNLYGVGPGDGVRIKPGKSGGHDRIVGIGGLLIVDLPGYGEGSLTEWGTEIMKYLVNRKQLRRVFVLVDAEHGIKDKDRSLLASLRLAGVSHQVVLSKLDKVWVPSGTGDEKPVRREAKVRKKREVKAKGDLAALRRRMEKVRLEVQPKVGGGAALGELLGVSSEVLVSGKRLGVDAVRVAVLRAAGVYLQSGRKLAIKQTWKKGAEGPVRLLSSEPSEDVRIARVMQ